MQGQQSNKLKRSKDIFKKRKDSEEDQSFQESYQQEVVEGKDKSKKSHRKIIKKKQKTHKKKKRKSKHKQQKHKGDQFKVEERQANKQAEENQKLQKSATNQQDKQIKEEQKKRKKKKQKSKKKSKHKKEKTKQTNKPKQNRQTKDQQEKSQSSHQPSDQSAAEAQQPQQKPKQKKKRKPRQNKKQKKGRQTDGQTDKAEQIDVDDIKVQQNYNWQVNNEHHNSQLKTKKKQMLSLEDSERIIYLFSLDAGDYRGIRKQIPHIAQRKIRGFLKKLFQYSLQKITERARESGRKIKDWQVHQKREIIRQLHRIRSSNRLLSEGNVEFRQLFIKTMQSYIHPQIKITDQNITFLYRKIEAFVRGFNHINFFRKNYYVPPTQEDERRRPIIQGGYIMQSKMKRQQRKRHEEYQSLRRKIDPDQLVLEWTQIQEKELCKLYLRNITNYQNIIENLRTRFGDSDKWRDFQIVGKKLDHLIKLGLDRLQEITLKGYYDPAQLMQEEKNRMSKKEHQKKKRSDLIKKTGISSFEDLQSVVYNNKEIIKEPRQVRQGGVIKNPSLLLKQVFAHVQSFKTKHRLVELLLNRYPEQAEVQQTIRTIKEFTEWANKEQQNNGVTLIRSRIPVIDSQHRSQALSAREDRSVTHMNKEQNQSVIFQRGIKYLEQGQNEYPKKEHNDDSPVYFSATADGVYKDVQTISECKSKVVQVYQSDQSEYEGFINPK